jgi:hypothetical protein
VLRCLASKYCTMNCKIIHDNFAFQKKKKKLQSKDGDFMG